MIPVDSANPFSSGFDAGFGCLPLTRLAVYGTSGPQYGDFAGKAEQEIVEEVATPTGGWSVDPYGYEDRRRRRVEAEDQAKEQAEAAIARAQEAARDAISAKAEAKADRAVEATRLAREEVTRLIEALEGQARQDRRRKLAAVLLLM